MKETDKHVISHCELKKSEVQIKKKRKQKGYDDGKLLQVNLLGELKKESNGR